MQKTLFVSLLLMAGALAGCISDDDGTDTPPTTMWTADDQVTEPDWAVRSIFIDEEPTPSDRWADHDHADPAIHKGLSTPNFQVTGHDPLRTERYGGAPGGAYFCGHASGDRDDGRRLAAVVSLTTEVAIVVVDITDEDNPRKVGELVMPAYTIYDVDITPDGHYAVLAATNQLGETTDFGPDVPPAKVEAYWRDACTGESHLVESVQDDDFYGEGTLLVDLRDPSFPRVVDILPDVTRNVHSVSLADVDGTIFVATSSLMATTTRGLDPDVLGLPGPPDPRFGNLLSHFQFSTLTPADGDEDASLEPYSVHTSTFFGDAESAINIAPFHNRHVDATIQKHPLTGDVIAYIANWEGGYGTVRLDGEGQVTALDGFYAPEEEDTGTEMLGRAHSAVPIGETWTIDGEERHLTIWGQEVIARPTGRPTGEMILSDTTDPANIIPVARWTIPVDHDWGGGDPFSSHYPFMVGETMFVAMYHYGFWAVDARPEMWPELPSIGVFMPDGDAPAAHHHFGAPEVLEGFDLGNGRLGVLDANTGYYTVQWTGPHPDVPPTTPWTEDAWIE